MLRTDRILRACSWLDERLPLFALSREPALTFPTLKGIAELAHAADQVLRSEIPDAVASAERWLAYARAQITGGELLTSIIAGNSRLVTAATLFLPFHLCGDRNPALLTALSAQLSHARISALEWALLIPVLHEFGLAATPEAVTLAQSISVFATRPDPTVVPVEAAYVLAHECLYAAGFGRRPPLLDESLMGYLAVAIPSLLLRYVGKGDPDVTAELVLAWHVLRQSCVSSEAWSILDAAQGPTGEVVVRGPSELLLPRWEHPRLPRAYHTTLVAVMAWASCHHHV